MYSAFFLIRSALASRERATSSGSLPSTKTHHSVASTIVFRGLYGGRSGSWVVEDIHTVYTRWLIILWTRFDPIDLLKRVLLPIYCVLNRLTVRTLGCDLAIVSELRDCCVLIVQFESSRTYGTCCLCHCSHARCESFRPHSVHLCRYHFSTCPQSHVQSRSGSSRITRAQVIVFYCLRSHQTS